MINSKAKEICTEYKEHCFNGINNDMAVRKSVIITKGLNDNKQTDCLEPENASDKIVISSFATFENGNKEGNDSSNVCQVPFTETHANGNMVTESNKPRDAERQTTSKEGADDSIAVQESSQDILLEVEIDSAIKDSKDNATEDDDTPNKKFLYTVDTSNEINIQSEDNFIENTETLCNNESCQKQSDSDTGNDDNDKENLNNEKISEHENQNKDDSSSRQREKEEEESKVTKQTMNRANNTNKSKSYNKQKQKHLSNRQRKELAKQERKKRREESKKENCELNITPVEKITQSIKCIEI